MLITCANLLKFRLSSNALISKRNFYGYLISTFNSYDTSRVKEVGPDRAAAEWLLKNGAFVQWQGHHNYITDYNQIGVSGGRYIQCIDCTGSGVSSSGFKYLKGLKHVRELKLVKCWEVHDGAMEYVVENIADTLQRLEIVSNNIGDDGLMRIRSLKNLQFCRLGNLPEVKSIENAINVLKEELPSCKFEHESNIDASHQKSKKSFLSGLFGN